MKILAVKLKKDYILEIKTLLSDGELASRAENPFEYFL